MSQHEAMRSLRDHVREALLTAAKDRSAGGWEARERTAMSVAANRWAVDHGLSRRIAASDIKNFEGLAIGHVDYADKISWYVAEFLFHGTVLP